MLQLNVHVLFDEMITTTLFFKSYQHSELDFYCVSSQSTGRQTSSSTLTHNLHSYPIKTLFLFFTA